MDTVKKEFDVIVVGAGTAGTIAARFAARKGLRVCLTDRKPENLEPAKICGDAIESEVFDLLGIAHPQGEELSCNIKGVKLFPPDLKNPLTLTHPKYCGYIVDRARFGQRLLREALEEGVSSFLPNTKALDLVYENGSVAGVKVRLKNGETADLRSRIVIDTSGLNSVLRKKVKSGIIENELKKEDAVLCYREIVNFHTREQKVRDPGYITIILDKERAPGGYVWYFPKNEYALNIGLGVHMSYKERVKEFYKKSVFDEFLKTNNHKILSSGGGVVSVRRPLWSCADNGIMFAGDAAFQINPLHGGGIDPSMRAGYYAAITAAEAIGRDDCSLDSLWGYNVRVMHSFGAEYAGLDLMRIVLQAMSNEDANFGFRNKILNAGEILDIAIMGSIKPSLHEMALKAIRGFSRPRFLLRLNYLRLRMNEMVNIYRSFPESYNTESFHSWKLRVNEQYEKINTLAEKFRPGKTDPKHINNV